jgi:hypothetical protein
MLENPIQFTTIKNIQNHRIEYTNLTEICQGGPEIGRVAINGLPMGNHYFGGPYLVHDDFVYLPLVSSRFLSGRGFRLARVNINTNKMEIFKPFYRILFLKEVVNNKVIFYTDIHGINLTSFGL